VKLTSSITIEPFRHGKLAFAQHVRDLCMKEKFDCIAVDVPAVFQDQLFSAIGDLPYISAVIARDNSEPVYYVPVDPCDAAIEAIRQAMQDHIPCFCIGHPLLQPQQPLPGLPDEYAIRHIGFDGYASLCLNAVHAAHSSSVAQNSALEDPSFGGHTASQYLAHRLLQLKLDFKNILALVHFRHCAETVRHFGQERTHNLSFGDLRPSYELSREFINPDHLYFALGELPFVTAKFEAERYDPFAEKIDVVETIKSLFMETRDQYHDMHSDIIDLSPARIQSGITFLRNLTISESRFIPTLFDIVTAAKGIGGNSYGLCILRSAKYYPYLPFEFDAPLVSIGIDRMQRTDDNRHSVRCVNCFRDEHLTWRTLSIKPDPSVRDKRKYRFLWKSGGICSHVPEDRLIESFNAHVRKKAESILSQDRIITEKFSVSVKDGIDIRETMRNWFSSDIYIRELPPSLGAVDMVVIVFDDAHDDRYPHRTTWYAEHDEESTLTFYATDPFSDMIGPGIARSQYGGLSLLFPPRLLPNIFDMPGLPYLSSCAETLAYGGLLFSTEKIIPYVSARKPGVRLMQLAARFRKKFVWIPMSTFSMETIRRLRRFHVLNGKTVRSWASRFIGES
jgi:hypothetical protein